MFRDPLFVNFDVIFTSQHYYATIKRDVGRKKRKEGTHIQKSIMNITKHWKCSCNKKELGDCSPQKVPHDNAHCRNTILYNCILQNVRTIPTVYIFSFFIGIKSNNQRRGFYKSFFLIVLSSS